MCGDLELTILAFERNSWTVKSLIKGPLVGSDLNLGSMVIKATDPPTVSQPRATF